MEYIIEKFLIKKGFNPNQKGFRCFREGLMLLLDDDNLLDSLTKELYPLIGKKLNSTASKVERAMRYSLITSGYDMTNGKLLALFLIEIKGLKRDYEVEDLSNRMYIYKREEVTS